MKHLKKIFENQEEKKGPVLRDLIGDFLRIGKYDPSCVMESDLGCLTNIRDIEKYLDLEYRVCDER